jgi:hypothetical protein
MVVLLRLIVLYLTPSPMARSDSIGSYRELLGAVLTVQGQGKVKVLIPFTNPVIVGEFVYHCHILSHEDNGMMAVIEVVDPNEVGDSKVGPSGVKAGASPHRH